MKKARQRVINMDFLRNRDSSRKSTRYAKQQWIRFCEEMLKRGYRVTLTEALQTVSKYVTVHAINDVTVRVRFSNHKPITYREARRDCDIFVGVTNFSTTTTPQAIKETLEIIEAI